MPDRLEFTRSCCRQPELLAELSVAAGQFDSRAPEASFTRAELGLAPGEPVCFRVKSYNDAGTSAFSAPLCTTL